ncbi:helix-turn-helix domain-containing protein [Chelativorans salis]|uniref:AraC family transcriptional regulator n=1 Tax=Chelativorans salis TaxID=2978478 RepID=A0ABT2LKK9_9HYPH|nr:AraC family transcriptional regulator [Chelativorans sp. EGI FJ00035]MCT7375142.1 AraC family transcriptional regulator [Chelativorans sp. EGI FJ00035]
MDIVPENAGPRLVTAKGAAVHAIRPPGSQTFLPRNHVATVVLAHSPATTTRFGGGDQHRYDAYTGVLTVIPADVEVEMDWSTAREEVLVAWKPESLHEIAIEALDLGSAELRPSKGKVDPQALHMAELLKAELTRGEPPNEPYIESLIVLLGIHVLRNYSSFNMRPAPPKGGLSDYAARRVQEYVEEHFTRKLSVDELAAVCELSPGHFIHAFSKTFGQPPHRYLVNRRLAFAEKLLLDTEMTIAEVAYLSGFSSQSHLTSAMRSHKRITPARMRAKR